MSRIALIAAITLSCDGAIGPERIFLGNYRLAEVNGQPIPCVQQDEAGPKRRWESGKLELRTDQRMRLEWTTRVVSSIPGAPEGFPLTVVQQSPQYYYESYDDGRFEIWLATPDSPPPEPAYVGMRVPDGVALNLAGHVLYFVED